MKQILIVGASQGIGNAIATKLLKIEDNQIIAINRNPSQITSNQFKEYNLNVLTDQLPEIPTVDAIIYCPGSINLKPISTLRVEDFRADFEVNVVGAVKTIQTYLKQIKSSKKYPSILMFSSVATQIGMSFHATVAAAKASVEGLVKSLAAELAPYVRVNAIAPTLTDTPLAAKLLGTERMKEQMKDRHPLKNYLQAEEVADLACYLISEQAKAISGQIIPIDQGITTVKV